MSAADVLSSIWDDVTGTQPPLDAQGSGRDRGRVRAAWWSLPWTWPICRHVVTIAHEGAHGVAALLTGRSLCGHPAALRHLGADRVAGQAARARAWWPRRSPGTSARRCSASARRTCCGRQHALAVLWLAVLLLALLLLQIRNFFGLYVVRRRRASRSSR